MIDQDAYHVQRQLHARGNLSYLQFVRMVSSLWSEAHPDIPFVAVGGEQEAMYPVITYGLQLRKTHPSEPKPRYREEIRTYPDEDAIIIGAQRFQNVVNFSVTTKRDPELAENIIEAFEDFMQEYIPIFKELGVSELVYARRLPDAEESRPGEGVVRRTVSYLVTTEKVTQITARKLNDSMAKLKELVVHLRVRERRLSREDVLEQATPSTPDDIGVLVELQDELLTPADGHPTSADL